MVFQEVLPVLLSPPSLAGAAFYILVYALIERMAKSYGVGKGKVDTGAGPEIRREREQGEDRNRFTEVDLATEQLKERYVIYSRLNSYQVPPGKFSYFFLTRHKS